MPRKTLAAISLLALCAGAHAEWKEIAASAVGTMTYDTTSVKRDNGRTHLQYRIDFPTERKTAQGKSVRSATMNVSVDCKAATVRLVDFQTNSGPHGEGEIVDRQTVAPSPGEKVASNSSSAALFKVACPGVPLPASATESAPHPATPAAKPAPTPPKK